MTKKILLGGVVGGIVLFIWGALAWTVLPLHNAHIKTIPNEDAVTGAMRDNLTETGFYFFPSPGKSGNLTKEEGEAWTAKYRRGPVGILVVQPNGREPMPPSALVNSLIIQMVTALVAAFLLSKAIDGLPSYGARVQFVTFLGLIGGLLVDLPYWNWFGFTTSYTIANVADHVIGAFLCGLVLASIVKKPAA